MDDTSENAVNRRLGGNAAKRAGAWAREYGWVAIWLLPPVLVSAQAALDGHLAGRPVNFPRLVNYNVLRWVVWAPLCVWIQWLAGRTRRLSVHGLSALGCLVVANAGWVLQGLRVPANADYSPAGLFLIFLPISVMWAAMVYLAVAWWVWGRQARAQLAEARLEALRRQLQPHFFFNTLHTIAGLVRMGRGDDAITMTARLGDLLRETLSDESQTEASLEQELALLDSYLAIERVRFGDRLQIRIDVPPELMHARVPVLLLQPLVENALEHGVAAQPGGGWVEVRALRNGSMLELRVLNSGHAAAAPVAEGIGLRNSRERLRTLYGERTALQLSNDGGNIVTVCVRMPFRAMGAS